MNFFNLFYNKIKNKFNHSTIDLSFYDSEKFLTSYFRIFLSKSFYKLITGNLNNIHKSAQNIIKISAIRNALILILTNFIY